MKTTQFYLFLPQQEPPPHVLEALKLVRTWQLEVMASEQRKAAIADQVQQQVVSRTRDWRDDLMGTPSR